MKHARQAINHAALISAWCHYSFVDKTENKTEVIVKSGLEHFYSEDTATKQDFGVKMAF